MDPVCVALRAAHRELERLTAANAGKRLEVWIHTPMGNESRES